MNILLTNDDGFYSDGIRMLAKALRSKGKNRVCVLAPDTDRSGVSNCLSIFNPLALTEKSADDWTCSGLPADCVIAAVLGGEPCAPDIIVSGINRGANIGIDLLYSGTAAAARQGALFGIPSIALSLDGRGIYHWEMAALYAAEHLDEYIALWRDDIFINVNIPNNADGPDGMVMTWPVRKRYNDQLSVCKGPGNKRWCCLVPGQQTINDEKGSDWDALSRNLVSVSPVYIHPVVQKDLCPEAPDHSSVGKQDG